MSVAPARSFDAALCVRKVDQSSLSSSASRLSDRRRGLTRAASFDMRISRARLCGHSMWFIVGVLVSMSPRVDGGTFFTVTSGGGSGGCTESEDCFYSPNYPGPYPHGDACTIRVEAAGAGNLDVQAFNVETSYGCPRDNLRVRSGGTKYCGTAGPDGISVSAGDNLYWTTNTSVTNTGFKICAEGSQPPTRPTPKPTAAAQRKLPLRSMPRSSLMVLGGTQAPQPNSTASRLAGRNLGGCPTCNSGYADSTGCNANYWGCGSGCAGGACEY